ncbi:MAG: hypothetical protein UW69_C0002G0009 [Microgenomates group bacterium GW2011_GWA2_44_7]|uniref:Uncharacterized protein n=1 Tax=Candidatus Woesebacteria bacterium GW2011_GWA1_43_12 TaxID=1618557 RepID=A0A0G1F5B2_9BACT|nr:MAG: hypothetical protein UV66_C0004G0008 [Candidatus Woesebacteria bacterium GW2011_GWA1_43_12]KKT76251.1 MAG: hypothetical protein UW69_C0002G0009 [Microgenomates group bacterium GW2011_GWA2_44_7]KKT77725.1 MAG: hypothetical protein UW73_C0013G0008 [Microgenomates group bacterium GW2011_GWB1_44_8]
MVVTNLLMTPVILPLFISGAVSLQKPAFTTTVALQKTFNSSF